MKLFYFCTIEGCTRKYSDKFNLSRHIDAFHKGDKKYECPTCHKVLSSKQNLKEHVFTHSGDKPYQCLESGCGMKFRQGSQLSAHKRIHIAVQKYSSKIGENSSAIQKERPKNWLANFVEKTEQCNIDDIKQLEGNEIPALPTIGNAQNFTSLPTYILYSYNNY
ncbi:unnamed protein product [Blepharisma stoltei]|uniref:C2H2-type domain-containing protein n=1 Tax=Blepharisma stoltei TaxID=1481888 RepID=A0AAU9K0U7_9CILI|nr:unnamed protein product [Blepharisma stoltei]